MPRTVLSLVASLQLEARDVITKSQVVQEQSACLQTSILLLHARTARFCYQIEMMHVLDIHVRTCLKGIKFSSQRELSGKISTLLKQNSEASSSLVEIMLGSWPDCFAR